MHNKTLTVPRDLLALYLSGVGGDWVEAGHELRALLAKSELAEHCKQCAEVVKTWPESKRDCLGKIAAPDTPPPAPVAADGLQAIQDRHEAWLAGVEQGKAESELGAIKESEEFEKWRNAQIDVLIRNGYPAGAEAFRNLGSVHWAGWQARARLDKVKEFNNGC